MINWLIFLVLGVLILASYLDFKYKAVPSVLLSGLVFVVILMRPYNLLFGIILFIFGIMIKDLIDDVAGLDFGVADIKILVIIGLMFTSSHIMFTFVITFAIIQFIYVYFWRMFISKEDLLPFIPVLLLVYVVLMLIGGVA